MWRAKAASGTGAVTVGDGAVILGAGCAMIQRLEKAAELDGLQMSYSVCADGGVVSGTFVWDSGRSYAVVASGAVQLSYSGTARYVQIYNTSAADVSVEWAKLEQGRLATPFTLPDPATELAKCQRYYYRLGFADRATNVFGYMAPDIHTYLNISDMLPPNMRIKPTLTGNPINFEITDANNVKHTCTGAMLVIESNNSGHGSCFYLLVKCSEKAETDTALLTIPAGEYIEFSAEL